MRLLQISSSKPFRGLAPTPFETTSGGCTFGRRTLIYGRNGSGKTTLSELLRTGHEGLTLARVLTEAKAKEVPLADVKRIVYNRFYVAESLSTFVEGGGYAPSIAVRLGESSVKIEKVASGLEQHYKGPLATRLQNVTVTLNNLTTEVEQLERSLQSEIIAKLAPGNGARYNSTAFTLRHVKKLLDTDGIVSLDEPSLNKAVATATGSTVEEIEAPTQSTSIDDVWPPRHWAKILSRPLNSATIPLLVENPELSSWVEKGVQLHTEGEACKFCNVGVITSATLDTYAKHFSKALDNLRAELSDIEATCETEKKVSLEWVDSLPEESALIPELRAEYQETLEVVKKEVLTRTSYIDDVLELVRERQSAPFKPIPPNALPPKSAPTVSAFRVREIIKVHNERCARQDESRKEALQTVEKHFTALRQAEWKEARHRKALADRARVAIESAIDDLEDRALRLRESMSDTAHMAGLLDEDISQHFGMTHLNVSASKDGKGYAVTRNSSPATHLSEGERNALAFSYFLRSIGATEVVPEETVVVVDDPVTSLDKEALFSAFALAEERTKAFAQVIFLTHDFEYFRLLLNESRTRYLKSLRKIREGDRVEAAFPRVQPLEMIRSIGEDGNRISYLRKFPEVLVKSASEYHYLFEKVSHAIVDPDSSELPLLGNAARRIIEGFISFRAPHESSFQEKVSSVAQDNDIDQALAKRVVKFLHGQSHREEARPSAAPDFPTLEEELRAAMKFIRMADEQHFLSMCAAVEVDPDLLRSGVGGTHK